MFYNSCSGCLQVPVPVQYWSPYIAPAKKSSFHIADILRHHMTNSVPPSHQNVTRERSNVKHVILTEQTERNKLERLTKAEVSLTKRHRKSALSRDLAPLESVKRLKHRDVETCSLSSALLPLQALCTAGPHYSEGKETYKRTDNSRNLKFGINRILSEDFGKEKKEKENNPENESCECSDIRHMSYPTYALSAVHALQPPRYPMSPTDADTLPGPYSVLNTEVNGGSTNKRKRSWSRAVFSNLQRKGLEKRFDVQKYVTKPDRRQLAAMLGLTDAQVKVWFQNRRMKWRHSNQQHQQKTDSNKDTCKEGEDMEDSDSNENKNEGNTELA